MRHHLFRKSEFVGQIHVYINDGASMESKISIEKYYETFSEASRLQSPAGQLEFIR